MSDARQWTLTWVRRTLTRKANMMPFSEGGTPPPEAQVMIPRDDRVIGIYSNGPSPAQPVVITEDSIVFYDERWRRLRFAEISGSMIDMARGKLAAERINLWRDGNPDGSVTISGGGERHRDVFEFYRFLGNVIAIHRGEW